MVTSTEWTDGDIYINYSSNTLAFECEDKCILYTKGADEFVIEDNADAFAAFVATAVPMENVEGSVASIKTMLLKITKQYEEDKDTTEEQYLAICSKELMPKNKAKVKKPKATKTKKKITRRKKTHQKSFTEITGAQHSSGEEFYFTVFQPKDWPADVAKDIPAINSSFYFDEDYALAILISLEENEPLLAYGPPGCGKTATVEQICARVGRPHSFIQGKQGTDPSDYVGSVHLRGGDTKWVDGELTHAVRHGYVVLYDEIFKSSPQTNMVIQTLLDDRRVLPLEGHESARYLKAHENFRMIGADNIAGDGNHSMKYCAEHQDASTLNRFTMTVSVDYPSPKIEKEIMRGITGRMSEGLADTLLTLTAMIRASYDKGGVSVAYSVRTNQTLAKLYGGLGSVPMAFKFTYLNKLSDEKERQAVSKMFASAFASTDAQL